MSKANFCLNGCRLILRLKQQENGIVLYCLYLYPGFYSYTQWRNFGGLVEMAPLGGKRSSPSGAPGLRAYWGQFVKKWPKNLNK